MRYLLLTFVGTFVNFFYYIATNDVTILQINIVCRVSTSTIKEAVPELASYHVLRKHFEWLIDGPISHIVNTNLGPELKNLELFLR